MEPTYIIGQILGGIAIALGFLSYQMKTQKRLLMMQSATSLVFCLHYLLIGATSGMAMNIICIFRNLAYFYRNQKQSKSLWIPILFAMVLGCVGAISWDGWYTIFLLLGLVINTLCLSFSDPQNVRLSILVTSPMVIVYNVLVLSIGGIVYESVAIISALIGLLRQHKYSKG